MLSLVHAITNRIILSFGDFMTFGAFYAIVAVLVGAGFGVFDAGALVLALLVAVFGTAVLRIAAHRLAFAALIGTRSQALMIASVGVGIIVSETLPDSSGGREQWLPPVFQGRGRSSGYRRFHGPDHDDADRGAGAGIGAVGRAPDRARA